MSSDIDAIFRRLQGLVAEAGLPGVEEGTSYGTPALKVGGKAFVSVKNADTIVLSIPIDDKERLIEMAPEIYFQTDHYRGWPSLPVRVTAVGDDELRVRLIDAWRFRAPRKLAASFSGG
ncbi:MmcQ/YjbR family DNA-binding protein [Rhizobium sp. BK251]|uniref:MmcQ/YjbR family DNA-binding protein n=1 Tax=Rhizobium sp. BK251 TaxID=2512125 RepID=UPI001048B5D5|nr:MmcQ/YjbR family DNA-binding protein [Rhizobium sp. BK251]TCL76021.1 hypothetical protein EV286_101568 [Rhizobium sp. BK251]